MTKRCVRALIAYGFLIAWIGGFAATGRILQFAGQATESEELELAIGVPQDKSHVLLTDERYTYTVALPYYRSWTFSRPSDTSILGENAEYRVTVKRIPKRHATPKARLESVLAALEQSGMFTLKKPTFVEGKDLPVLKYRAKLSNPPPGLIRVDKWAWEFWTAVPHGEEWVSVHLSAGVPGTVLSKKEQSNLAAILGRLAGGSEESAKSGGV